MKSLFFLILFCLLQAPLCFSGTALFVVGNTTLNNGDQAIKARLEALGFIVTVVSGSSSNASQAIGQNLVFISSTINSTDVNTKFTAITVPVIVCEAALLDDLKMTASGSGTHHGTQNAQTKINMLNGAHALGAGLANGSITVYNSNADMAWGKPSNSAAKIAALTGNTQKLTIFGYEPGTVMVGLNAPARRVGFFLSDNSATLLTTQGIQLLNAAITWAAGASLPNVPPTINLTAPINGAFFTSPANINITATASDQDGTVTKVEFYEGNNLLSTDFNNPYSFAWNNVVAGSYTLRAIAYDDDNATTLKTTDITVNPPPNIPPSVNINAPLNGSVFIAPANINITATASDQDGSITKIEFYEENNLLSTDSNNPYSFAWNNVATGSYTLRAIAYDDDNATTLKTTSITVNPPPNIPPSVNIDTPVSGSTFIAPANIRISVTASDQDGSITKVEFFEGNNLLSTDFDIPYFFDWNNVAAGSYTLRAIAYDDNNGASLKTTNIIVNSPPLNIHPSVNITSPANDSTFTIVETITITATASDSDGFVTNVNFYYGSNFLDSDTSFPYSFSWNNVPVGNHLLTAVALDDEGDSTVSLPIVVTVFDTANVPPSISIINPSNGSAFVAPANVSITANASDQDGLISKVEFYEGNNLLSTDFDNPYFFDWNNVAAGSYTLRAIVFDDDSASAFATTNITVNPPLNAHPSVSIADPVNGSIFIIPTSITITATASDNDGSVAKINFYSGNNFLGADTSSPFSFSWNNVPVGSYTFTAVALDDDGDSTISLPVLVTFIDTVNILPSVSITNPTRGSSFVAPASISITASASDSDGTIAQVEFYERNNFLGTDSIFPFSFSWNNVPQGSYILKAKAFDNKGDYTISDTVGITVNTPAAQPFTVSISSPVQNVTFIAPAQIGITAKVEGLAAAMPYLKVTNTQSSWKNLKLGYDPTNIWNPKRNVIAGGNNVMKITLRDFNNNVNWSKIQVKPQSTSSSPSSLQSYVDAAGGIGNQWVTITIPLSHFPGFDFTQISYIELPVSKGSGAFQIGIQKVEFTGGTNPFLWFGDTKTNNSHDGDGSSSKMLAQLIMGETNSLTKMEFYNGATLLNADFSSPYSFNWSNVLTGNYILTAKGYATIGTVSSNPVHISVLQAIGDSIKITVTFNSAPSSCAVRKAPLKYNKDFAYSYTMDDGHMDAIRIAYPMFSGGYNEYDSINYPGMFYTDGCGHDVAFKAGLAWYSFNNIGQDLHQSRSTDNRLTWQELSALHAAGWDVLNHSLTHASGNSNIDYNYQVTRNVQYVDSMTGIDMKHFVIPAGDMNYTQPALNNGMIAVYNQSGSEFINHTLKVDDHVNLNQFLLKRQFLQNSTHSLENIASSINNAASLSVNGNHYWYNDASHNVTTDFGGNLTYPLFKYYIEYVANTYGKNGSNKMWMAPLQEVYEYLAVKQSTGISFSLNGNELVINMALSNIPAGLRRYALSLVVDADANINSVQVEGTTDYCYGGSGNEKLINLDWTDVYPNTSFKTATENTDIKELEADNAKSLLEIYPNPASDKIIVKFLEEEKLEEEVSIIIFDVTGRICTTLKRTSETVIDLSEIQPGFYFVKVWKAEKLSGVSGFVKY